MALPVRRPCRCWRIGRQLAAKLKGLVQCLRDARCRVLAVSIIHAVFAGQAGKGDPEPAQLGGGQLESHCSLRALPALDEVGEVVREGRRVGDHDCQSVAQMPDDLVPITTTCSLANT